MKKKILFLVLILCLVLYGCKKEETPDNKLLDNVKIEELGIIKSDLGEECLLLKATNNNSNNITVFSTVKLYDSSKKELASETGYISLYNKQSGYYIVEISSENKYDSYELQNDAAGNMYDNYKDIYNNVKLEQTDSDDKELINFKIENKSNKTISAKVLGLFYKNNKIIAASIGECEDVDKNNTCNDSIYIPVVSVDDYRIIDYDKVEISLMNVNYSN